LKNVIPQLTPPRRNLEMRQRKAEAPVLEVACQGDLA
jgi:hypothetical protein